MRKKQRKNTCQITGVKVMGEIFKNSELNIVIYDTCNLVHLVI